MHKEMEFSLLLWIWFLALFLGCSSFLNEDEGFMNVLLEKKGKKSYSNTVTQLLYDYFSPERQEQILRNHSDYKTRLPFPHMISNAVLPLAVLSLVEQEIPDNPELNEEGCLKHGQICFRGTTEWYKNAINDDSKYGPTTMAVFSFFRSSVFTRFLERLTGIQDLIPDPEYHGSGIHQTLSGGYLDVHADFNRLLRYDLHRRVNILLYLNPDWEEGYGGHLELWSKDMRSCHARVKPDIGTLAVFSTTDFSYHGHPNPLTCPKNRSRRSLALYYYTRSRPAKDCLNEDCESFHSTLFQTVPCKCEDFPCNQYLQSVDRVIEHLE